MGGKPTSGNAGITLSERELTILLIALDRIKPLFTATYHLEIINLSNRLELYQAQVKAQVKNSPLQK
jgi:hypothetical protein